MLPDNPKYSIVMKEQLKLSIGFDENKAANLRDKLNELLMKD